MLFYAIYVSAILFENENTGKKLLDTFKSMINFFNHWKDVDVNNQNLYQEVGTQKC